MKPTKPNLIPCILLTAITALLLAAGSVFYYWYTVPYLSFVGAKLSIAFVVIAGYYRWLSLSGRRRPQPLLGGRLRVPIRGLLVGLVTAIALYGLYRLVGDSAYAVAFLSLLRKQLILTPWLTPIALGAFVLLGSLVEELFFRGFLLNSFTDLGFPRTGLLTASLFPALLAAALALYWLTPLQCLALAAAQLVLSLLLLLANHRQVGVVNSWLAHSGLRLIVVLMLIQVL